MVWVPDLAPAARLPGPGHRAAARGAVRRRRGGRSTSWCPAMLLQKLVLLGSPDRRRHRCRAPAAGPVRPPARSVAASLCGLEPVRGRAAGDRALAGAGRVRRAAVAGARRAPWRRTAGYRRRCRSWCRRGQPQRQRRAGDRARRCWRWSSAARRLAGRWQRSDRCWPGERPLVGRRAAARRGARAPTPPAPRRSPWATRAAAGAARRARPSAGSGTSRSCRSSREGLLAGLFVALVVGARGARPEAVVATRSAGASAVALVGCWAVGYGLARAHLGGAGRGRRAGRDGPRRRAAPGRLPLPRPRAPR